MGNNSFSNSIRVRKESKNKQKNKKKKKGKEKVSAVESFKDLIHMVCIGMYFCKYIVVVHIYIDFVVSLKHT